MVSGLEARFNQSHEKIINEITSNETYGPLQIFDHHANHFWSVNWHALGMVRDIQHSR